MKNLALVKIKKTDATNNEAIHDADVTAFVITDYILSTGFNLSMLR